MKSITKRCRPTDEHNELLVVLRRLDNTFKTDAGKPVKGEAVATLFIESIIDIIPTSFYPNGRHGYNTGPDMSKIRIAFELGIDEMKRNDERDKQFAAAKKIC